jgi:GntR family transcriptional regulator
MMIAIDAKSPVATYEQILMQIRAAIAAGELAKGDPLPPIRQLARDLEINPATAAKAYQILEKEGLILTAGRRGTFVHANAKPNLKETLSKQAAEQMERLFSHWRERGVPARELREIFQRILQSE